MGNRDSYHRNAIQMGKAANSIVASREFGGLIDKWEGFAKAARFNFKDMHLSDRQPKFRKVPCACERTDLAQSRGCDLNALLVASAHYEVFAARPSAKATIDLPAEPSLQNE